jgi:putative ABC transport system permease protein
MKQFFAILEVVLGNIRQRRGSSLVTIIGIAGVVGVLISMLAMAQGLHRTLAATGRPDRAIIISRGATSESSSNIPHDTALRVEESAAVKKAADGKPISSKEMLVQLRLPMRDGTMGVVSVRGIEGAAMPLRPGIHLTQGRMFRPGLHELVVGAALQSQFPGLRSGKSIVMQNSPWTIVGAFASAAGDAHDSEVMGDAASLLSAYHRSGFQSVTVALDNAASLNRLVAELDADNSLGVEAHREDQYYAARSQIIIRVLTAIGIFVGGIMAIGAIFSALNTMYAAVAAEASLIATLRAIGFNRAAVLGAVLAEAMLLALAGAILGAVAAVIFFNGHGLKVLGNQAQIFYTMQITPALAMEAVVLALAIGIIGGLFPAIKAARAPLAEALRA